MTGHPALTSIAIALKNEFVTNPGNRPDDNHAGKPSHQPDAEHDSNDNG
jgi:hypothetical protein